MSFKFAHNNLNVLDLDKSIKFYEEALGFTGQNPASDIALAKEFDIALQEKR